MSVAQVGAANELSLDYAGINFLFDFSFFIATVLFAAIKKTAQFQLIKRVLLPMPDDMNDLIASALLNNRPRNCS